MSIDATTAGECLRVYYQLIIYLLLLAALIGCYTIKAFCTPSLFYIQYTLTLEHNITRWKVTMWSRLERAYLKDSLFSFHLYFIFLRVVEVEGRSFLNQWTYNQVAFMNFNYAYAYAQQSYLLFIGGRIVFARLAWVRTPAVTCVNSTVRANIRTQLVPTRNVEENSFVCVCQMTT